MLAKDKTTRFSFCLKGSMLCKLEVTILQSYCLLVLLCNIAETSAWGAIYSRRNRENYRWKPDIYLQELPNFLGCYKSCKALQAISGWFLALKICYLEAIQVLLFPVFFFKKKLQFHVWPSDQIWNDMFVYENNCAWSEDPFINSVNFELKFASTLVQTLIVLCGDAMLISAC